MLERIDAAYALVWDARTSRILLVQHVEGAWTPPGGRVENGETLAEAAARETAEEAGYRVSVGALLAVNEVIGRTHVIFHLFVATLVTDDRADVHDDETAGYEWVDLEEAQRRMPYWQVDFAELLNGSGAAYIVRYGDPE